jgi:hypothetical protein
MLDIRHLLKKGKLQSINKGTDPAENYDNETTAPFGNELAPLG